MKTLSALMLGLTMLAGTAAFAADSKDAKAATTDASKTSVKKHSKKGKKHAAATSTAKPAAGAAATSAPAPSKYWPMGAGFQTRPVISSGIQAPGGPFYSNENFK